MRRGEGREERGKGVDLGSLDLGAVRIWCQIQCEGC